MEKAARYLNTQQKEFHKTITGLCERKAVWQVWSDFLECSAIAISNCLDRSGEIHDKREGQYLRIIRGYKEQEQLGLCRLLGYVRDALEENPEQDFLGDMYMALNLNSHWHGQFFTPYHVSHFMARVTISKDDETLRERGWIGLNDPACGAGSLLIAARNVCLAEGIGYRQVLFTAQDVDRVVALMCYIQLSLLGCAGYVVVGDSLLHPVASMGSTLLPAFSPQHEVWFTPMFYDEVWQGRIQCAWLSLLLREAFDRETLPKVATKTEGTNAENSVTAQDVSVPKNEDENNSELLADQNGQLRMF